jgi:hypothetical protein
VKVTDTGARLISGNDLDKLQFRKFDVAKIDNLRLEETQRRGSKTNQKPPRGFSSVIVQRGVVS